VNWGGFPCGFSPRYLIVLLNSKKSGGKLIIWGTKPCFWFQYVQNTPLSVDLNLKVSHEDKFWYGFSFRAMESVNVFAGLGFAKRYSASYAYEWSVTAIRKYNYGTHEIILGMQVPPPRKVICPSKYW
jgi:hypothetical protein